MRRCDLAADFRADIVSHQVRRITGSEPVNALTKVLRTT